MNIRRRTKNVHPEICSPDGRLDIDIFSLFYFFAFHSGIFAVINFAFGFAIRTDFEGKTENSDGNISSGRNPDTRCKMRYSVWACIECIQFIF